MSGNCFYELNWLFDIGLRSWSKCFWSCFNIFNLFGKCKWVFKTYHTLKTLIQWFQSMKENRAPIELLVRVIHIWMIPTQDNRVIHIFWLGSTLPYLSLGIARARASALALVRLNSNPFPTVISPVYARSAPIICNHLRLNPTRKLNKYWSFHVNVLIF